MQLEAVRRISADPHMNFIYRGYDLKLNINIKDRLVHEKLNYLKH